MKKFCKDLKNRVTRIFNYEKKRIIPLTIEERNISKKKFRTDNDDIKHHKIRDHCHYTGKYRAAAHNICNLRYTISKEILAVFHNGSTYDYHLIIKALAEEFEGPFECLGENTEKYITFSVPINLIMIKQLHTK